MKKKQIANLIMVGFIAVIMISGIFVALLMRNGDTQGHLGSQFTKPTLTDDISDQTCTITIVCDTVLENTDKLNPAKMPYVPDDGIILKQTTVSFDAGETVFAVLKRVCENAGIQIEYSWAPLYDSYYVEGINHLYEFDCGPESGWMYRVNGQFPNYGCSSYELKGNEEIVWYYTCDGLGTDVGAPRE